jgi:hypothetical protein
MKSVLRWRHYCDHCNKALGTKPSMVKHEARCTANPGRVCSMCQISGEVQLSMDALQVAYAEGFNALRAACNNCPACTLAAIRQYAAGRDWDDEGISLDSKRIPEQGEWSFKEDCKAFWKNWNEDQNPRCC